MALPGALQPGPDGRPKARGASVFRLLRCQIGLNAKGPRFRDKVIVFWQRNPFYMFFEYIQAAISKAVYEVIDDEEPYYGEVPDLEGVWATGKTPEECRENFFDGHRGLDCF